MKKKLAIMLIIFMIGTWCAFAEGEDEGVSPEIIVLGTALVVLLIGGGIAFYLAASGDQEGAQRVMDSLSVEKSEEDIPAVAKTVMENPLVKHITLGFNKDNVFIGLRFAW